MDGPPLQMYESNSDRLPSGQACLTCRKRKLKCDGFRPCCSFCTKRSLQCIYDKGLKQSAASREYVETLEEKVRRLEQELRQRNSPPSVVAQQLPTPESSDAALVQDFQSRHPQPSRARPAHLVKAPLILPNANSTSLEKDNDFVKVIRYGEVSIHSAMADFGLAPSGTSPSDGHRSSTTNATDITSVDRDADICSSDSLGLDDNSYILPPRQLAFRLVDLFFEHTYPLLPLVHEPTFRKDFSDIYDHHRPGSVAFRSLINVIFAYGCDYLDLDLLQTYELSQDFHERATDLILLVCYDLASLEVVQALLLVTLHLYSSMQFHRMWINTGLLVRTAQALNLHLDPSGWNISLIDKELRKRLWWSIYSLDRFISFKLCRPAALTIGSDHPSPPTTVDDEQILAAFIKPLEPGSRPSLLHFFNSLLQLIYISETCLPPIIKETPRSLGAQLANENSKEDPRIRLYTQIMLAAEQESKLTLWLTSLPNHLRFDANNSDLKLRKQQHSLQIRYLHAKLMTHRPNVVLAIKLDKERGDLEWGDTFLQSILVASIRQCTVCACELIDLVKDWYEKSLLGPWWLLVQYLFTTLGTLFAVRARGHLMKDLDDEAIHLSIDKAMGLLRSLGDINSTLTQCRTYFETMDSCVTKRKSHQTDNDFGDRGLAGGQSPLGQLTNSMFLGQSFHQYPGSSTQTLPNFQVNNFQLFNPDQAMTDYSADILTDTTFGGFNFGGYNPC